MERERSGKIPWIVVLLLVTALCALSYLAAYLVHRAGGEIVGRMAILAEGEATERDDLIYLEKLPLFNKDGDPIA